PDTVHQQVLAAGWPADAVEKAFYAVQASVLPSNMANPVVSSNKALAPVAAGRRRGRIATGWALFKASLSILNGNRYLLRYLLMTGVWVFGITAVFIAIYIVFYEAIFQNNYSNSFKPIGYVFMFLDYLLIYFFINLYAAGLTANVFDIFKGQRKPYAEYMRIAWSKAPAILVFSIIEAIIGMILRLIAERSRLAVRIIVWLVGTAWSLATLFVIPIIVNSDKPSGVRSIKESIGFFKQTWGENITAKTTVNAPLFLIQLALLVGFSLLEWPVIMTGSMTLFWIFFITYWSVMITLAVIGSFANSLVNIALYFFATQHEVPPAFSAELLNQVFIPWGRGLFGKKEPQATS
ncbi:MAG: DUF6159 family protein, partial [Candidatus Saccharimonadales bacterium]